MSSFSEYLNQLIQSREISISGLSRDSGVERTAIHKALTGVRILPYPSVELLNNSLKLSPQESQKLYQYYDQLFESETAVRAREVIDRTVVRMSELPAFSPDDCNLFLDVSPPAGLQEKSTYKGYGEISRLLRFVIAGELKREQPQIELAIPADVPVIEECIEQIYRCRSDLKAFHIVCFDACETADGYNLHNIECMSHILPACMISNRQYHVFYYYNDISHSRYTDPLPYFLVTHAGAVCFSENCQTAIFLTGEEQIEYFHSCFCHLKQNCHSLIEYVGESEAAQSEFGEQDGEEEYCVIMSQLCKINLQAGKPTVLFTRKGIAEFLNTGRLYNVFAGTEEAIGERERIGLLAGLFDAGSGNRVKVRLMNDMMFPMPEQFKMLASARKGSFIGSRHSGGVILIRERSLSQAFYHWGIHFSDSDRVFDKEETMEIYRTVRAMCQKRRVGKAQIMAQVESVF